MFDKELERAWKLVGLPQPDAQDIGHHGAVWNLHIKPDGTTRKLIFVRADGFILVMFDGNDWTGFQRSIGIDVNRNKVSKELYQQRLVKALDEAKCFIRVRDGLE